MKTTWVALVAGMLGATPTLFTPPIVAAQELFPFDVEATPVVEETIDTPFAVERTPITLPSATTAPPTPEDSVAPVVPVAPIERLPAPDVETIVAPAPERLPALNEPPGPSEPVVSPMLWIYLQERSDRLDPKLAVRAKAALEAEQRQARIAARKWYGTSLARPVVSPTPFTSGYAPGWEPAVRYYKSPTVVVPVQPVNPVEGDAGSRHDPWGRERK